MPGMKLVTFDEGRVGRIDDEVIVEFDCASTREWFERGGDVPETGERVRSADARLRAPIVPKKFFHTAGNFAVHHEGLTKELEYELELAIIIGKSGKWFSPDEASEYIAGFTVFNDITARDI